MRNYPQFEDLGLWPEEDRTDDLRPGKENDPRTPGAPTPGGGRSEHPTRN